MPVSRLCALAAALLLGLLLLGLPPATGAGERAGVCPQLPADVNCTKECLSDSDCADYRKCCQAGCGSVCSIPNGDPAATRRGRAGPRRMRVAERRVLGRRASLPPGTPEEKPGSCPNVDLPQLGICQDQCQEDSQCTGPMKCCRNGCGKVSCVTPDP
ncbi:WAP four-disulfide core domain protein 2 isoform X1 [Marmota monax]|uniref:WAP four-disulfide core domain protein 2 isoform X1 n=1 Tax=Marmota monax TaxID=9995 RepID=UPI0026EE6DCA|nr:WAP four-disulfide core domain protein 2 isoform X1 [Marmota monax]